MYLVRSPIFTKRASDPTQFIDLPVGIAPLDVDVDPDSMAELVEKGQVVELKPREEPKEEEWEVVEVNMDEVEVPVKRGEVVVLVENEEAKETVIIGEEENEEADDEGESEK